MPHLRALWRICGRGLLALALALTPGLHRSQAAPGQTWTCWPTGGPSCNTTLLAVSLPGAGEGWAVGEDGVMVRLAAGEWQPAEHTEPGITLAALDLLDAAEGWAVGYTAGTWQTVLLRYTAGAWGPFPSPQVNRLLAVQALEAADAWAAGDELLHFDGASWTQVGNLGDVTLSGLDMLNAGEGWAAGSHCCYTNAIFHYSGGQWTEVAAPPGRGLNAVDMLGPDEGWAVGDGILRYDSGAWTRVDSPPGVTLTALEMAGPDEGWAAGYASGLPAQGVVLRYTGAAWEQLPLPAPGSLYGMALDGAGQGWIVGENGTMLQLDGGQWQVVTSPPQVDFQGVDARGGEAWAVGAGCCSTGLIFHYEAGEWRRHADLPGGGLNAVSAVGPGQVWAVGYHGFIWRLSGDRWLLEPTPLAPNLYGISMVSADRGWAVGVTPSTERPFSVILQYRHGAWWLDPFVAYKALYAVSAISAGEAWAVGQGGLILRFKKWRWRREASPTSETLTAIQMQPDGTGYAVGAHGVVLRRTPAGEWMLEPPATSTSLRGIAIAAPEQAWAVGDYGAILSGPPWETVPGPTTQHLQAVSVDPASGEGWAVGTGGAILHLTPGG